MASSSRGPGGGARAQERLAEVRGREALSVVTRIGPAMALLLIAFAVYDALSHPSDEVVWRVLTDLVPAAVLAVIAVLQRRGRVTPANAGWFVVIGSLAVSASVLVTVVVGVEAPILGYLLVMTMVNGATALSTAQFVLAQTVPVLGTLLAVLLVPGLVPAERAGDWVAVLLVTVAASVAIHLSRERGFRELASALEVLEQEAVEDPVTGLGTRRALDRLFPVVVSSAEVSGQRVFLLFADVDGLKSVNDTAGHDAGDLVIRAVADALRASAGPHDVLARWGGDEFAVLGFGDEGAPDRLEADLKARIATAAPAGTGWVGTVSVGTATSEPAGCDLGALVAAADGRMYERRRIARA